MRNPRSDHCLGEGSRTILGERVLRGGGIQELRRTEVR